MAAAVPVEATVAGSLALVSEHDAAAAPRTTPIRRIFFVEGLADVADPGWFGGGARDEGAIRQCGFGHLQTHVRPTMRKWG